MNIRKYLTDFCGSNQIDTAGLQFPDCELDPANIKVMMISEVPPANPDDFFYSSTADPDYMKTTLGLFRSAGVHVNSIGDILNLGIYVTTAVKAPKTAYTVDPVLIKEHLPILKAELDLFADKKVIMLMGDVAKKAVNQIHKACTKKNLIPSESTYKIRSQEFFWDDIRVFPSYIITGGNILIEKSKCDMIADDIRRMMEVIG